MFSFSFFDRLIADINVIRDLMLVKCNHNGVNHFHFLLFLFDDNGNEYEIGCLLLQRLRRLNNIYMYEPIQWSHAIWS